MEDEKASEHSDADEDLSHKNEKLRNSDSDEEEVEAEDDDSESDEGDESNEEEEDGESVDDDQSSDDSSSDDEDDDDENDDESSSGSDDEEAGAAANTLTTTADGREISAYEKLRLDRIRRNQEKLAQLGLEGNKEGGGVLGERKKKAKRTRKKEEVKMRNSLSRHTKAKPMNYAEPPSSVAALLRKQQEADTKLKGENKKTVGTPKKKGKDINERMDKHIHREFNRLKGYKTLVKKRTDRNVKHARRELTYWGKRYQKLQQRKLRQKSPKQGSSSNNEHHLALKKLKQLEEQQHLGGTTKQLLQQVDARMPELIEAAAKYDEKYEAEEQRYAREVRQLEDEHRMNLLDGLERFPKAIRESTSLLNATLLERAPKDAPAPRRSRRSIEEEEEESPSKKKKKQNGDGETGQQAGGKRKRQAKNVGGWVSPQFASEIDKEWLNRDSPEKEFDVRSYVPQAGDIVLYYPTAHMAFLHEYPDWLGRKTKSVMRLPLWERAAMEGEREERTKTTRKRNSSIWYTEEWLEGVRGELGKYPILCKVHSAYAEFPADYFVKVLKNGVVSWKAPKENTRKPRDESSSRLRLSLILRPLTAVVPPAWESSRVHEAKDSRFKDDQALSPAPLFSVVTFPCKLAPFIIPFSWAYSRTHSLSEGQTTDFGPQQAVVNRFEGLANSNFRLDEKTSVIKYVLDTFTKKLDDQRVLLERKTNVTKTIPLPDVKPILGIFDSCLKRSSDTTLPSEPVDFLSLIRSTLPLWDSVVVDIDGDSRAMCPWDLKPDSCPSEQCFPQLLAESYGLDEPLRARIAAVFEKAVKDEPIAATFQRSVSDEDAPSYDCAVPLSMSFEKIQQRLQPDKHRSQVCYYSCVDSVLSDVSMILDNCLLYNSPESPVVAAAITVVTKLKDEIVGKSRHHIREIDTAKKATEDRRLRMMQILEGDNSNDNLLKDLFVVNSLRQPHRTECQHDWLEKVVGNNSGASDAEWVPQAGDRIMYSPDLHARFVEDHEESFEPYHCSVHHFEGDADSLTDTKAVQWKAGRIVWIRCSFPKALAKKRTQPTSFQSQSTLLVLGIKFDEDHKELAKLRAICWRPCCFPEDNTSGKTCTCSIPLSTSFLKPERDVDNTDYLSSDDAASIVSVLSLLKKRCIQGNPIDYVDTQITKNSLNRGYMPALEHVSEKLSPIFSDAYGAPTSAEAKTTSPRKGKRGFKGAVRPRVADSVVKKLLGAGFLAPFASGQSGSVDEASLRRYKTLSPWPKLSLELILLRLSNGYYRCRSAVENDMIEAYANVANLMISEAVGRKREPVSMKKLCRALASEKGGTDTQTKLAPADVESKSKVLSDEEQKFVSTLRRIRELYATALVAAAETQHSARLFGLRGPSVPSNVSRNENVESASQADARNRLRLLLAAVGRDQLQNAIPGVTGSICTPFPPRQVRVICQGKAMTAQKRVITENRTIAVINEKEHSVKIRCDKKLVSVDRIVAPQVSSLKAKNDGVSTSVTIVCDGDNVAPDTPPRTSRAKSSKERVVTVNSIQFNPCDYEHNENLVRLFFGKESCRKTCARCLGYRRSMLVCRVRRGHSNPDFDWIDNFRGLGSLDNLLRMMNGEELVNAPETATPAVEEKAPDDIQAPSQPVAENNESQLSAENNEDVNEANVDSAEIDAKAMFEKAENAFQLASAAQQRATAYVDGPVRLSSTFVATTFPIDESDGHCVYCVVCGLSGDLLCCDGCSNVVHGKCVGISELPEGDWFCEECEMKKSGADTNGKLPFGRNEYDIAGDEELAATLEGLHSSRPDLRKRKRQEKPKPPKKEETKAAKPQVKNTGVFKFLAQMAQDFLADAGISSTDDLLNLRTIEVAKMFAKWRRKVGMPRLNGGGEGAYVGSWKTMCRKNVSRQKDNKVVYLSDDGGDDGEDPIDSDDGDFGERKKKRRRKRKNGEKRKSTGSRRKTVDFSSLDDPLEGLSETNRNFLKSLDITTAAKFLTTRTSDLGEALKKWRKKEGLPPLKGTGVIATMSAAKTVCRHYAREMGLPDLANSEPGDSVAAISSPNPSRRKSRSPKRAVVTSPTPTSRGRKGKPAASPPNSKPVNGRRTTSRSSNKNSTPASGDTKKKSARGRKSAAPKDDSSPATTPRLPGKRSSRSPNRYGVSGNNEASGRRKKRLFSAVDQARELLVVEKEKKPAAASRKRRRSRR